MENTVPTPSAANDAPITTSAVTGTISAATPTFDAVWRYNGTPDSWTQIGGPAARIYGGGYGLVARTRAVVISIATSIRRIIDKGLVAPAQTLRSPITRFADCLPTGAVSGAITARQTPGRGST